MVQSRLVCTVWGMPAQVLSSSFDRNSKLKIHCCEFIHVEKDIRLVGLFFFKC